MLTPTTVGTFVGAAAVTAAVDRLIGRSVPARIRRWVVWAVAVAVVAAGGMWASPVSAARVCLWLVNGALVAASVSAKPREWDGPAGRRLVRRRTTPRAASGRGPGTAPLRLVKPSFRRPTSPPFSSSAVLEHRSVGPTEMRRAAPPPHVRSMAPSTSPWCLARRTRPTPVLSFAPAAASRPVAAVGRGGGAIRQAACSDEGEGPLPRPPAWVEGSRVEGMRR